MWCPGITAGTVKRKVGAPAPIDRVPGVKPPSEHSFAMNVTSAENDEESLSLADAGRTATVWTLRWSPQLVRSRGYHNIDMAMTSELTVVATL